MYGRICVEEYAWKGLDTSVTLKEPTSYDCRIIAPSLIVGLANAIHLF